MSEKPKRPVLGGRTNPITGELEIYEMTPEEADETIRQLMECLPKPEPITPKDIEKEAKRGADNARRFLARNPTRREIQQAYEWSFEDAAFGNDGPLSLAYEEAWREVVRRHLV